MARKIQGLGQVSLSREIDRVLPELVKPAKFIGVGAGWVALDFIGHQLFEVTRGDRTPPNYYGNKLLFSVPFLIAGRIAADLLGGPRFIKALTIGTVANSLMQLRYVFGQPFDFNLAVFLIHEVALLPLSLLIAGDEDRILPGKGSYK